MLIDLGETQRVKEASHSSSDLVDVQIPLTVRAEEDLPALPIRKLKPDSEPKVVV
ncbi:MAG: hypothetical protein ICV77_11900 [Cyanobacteria bacterium Co-bin8]|nr:hypothetical protein [Cyanobacteria bacterium Co-bin8]